MTWGARGDSVASAEKKLSKAVFCPSTNILDHYAIKINEEDTKLPQRCC